MRIFFFFKKELQNSTKYVFVENNGFTRYSKNHTEYDKFYLKLMKTILWKKVLLWRSRSDYKTILKKELYSANLRCQGTILGFLRHFTFSTEVSWQKISTQFSGSKHETTFFTYFSLPSLCDILLFAYIISFQGGATYSILLFLPNAF